MYIRFWTDRQLARGALLLMLLLVAGFGYYGWTQTEARSVSASTPVRSGDPQAKAVALAINVDWGEENLGAMLDVLGQHKARATFFLTGRWAEKNPDMAAKIAKQGHELGNHGYSHPHPNQLGKAANQQDIRKAEEVLVRLAGQRPLLYAPPYGEANEVVVNAADELGYTTVLWSVDTIDWQEGSTPAVILQRVQNKLQPGGIVLMHPTPATVKALSTIIQWLHEKGYQAVTVSQLLS